MCTAHINFTKNQRYMFFKYQNICSKLLYRKKYHYWCNAAANRWLKKADDMGREGDIMLYHIYKYPKWWIQGVKDGNLTEVLNQREKRTTINQLN